MVNLLSDPDKNIQEDFQSFAEIAQRGGLGGPEEQKTSR